MPPIDMGTGALVLVGFKGCVDKVIQLGCLNLKSKGNSLENVPISAQNVV